MNKTSESAEKTEAPRVLLSDTDAYVHDRMKAQPGTLKDIDLKVEPKRDPTQHRLSLPKELKTHENKYAFRWIMKHKQALDYSCDVRGWVLVNQTYFPDLPRHLFTVNGSIERGDSILAFISKQRAEEIRKEPGEKSTSMVKGMYEKHKDDPRYYTPDAGTKEKEGVNVIRI